MRIFYGISFGLFVNLIFFCGPAMAGRESSCDFGFIQLKKGEGVFSCGDIEFNGASIISFKFDSGRSVVLSRSAKSNYISVRIRASNGRMTRSLQAIEGAASCRSDGKYIFYRVNNFKYIRFRGFDGADVVVSKWPERLEANRLIWSGKYEIFYQSDDALERFISIDQKLVLFLENNLRKEEKNDRFGSK